MKQNTKVTLGALALLSAVTALTAPVLLTAGPARASVFHLVAPRHCDNARLDFSLTNNTGHVIKYLYVSPSSKGDWGNDWLGNDVIANGDTWNMHFPADENEDTWDIKVVLDNDNASTKMKVDLSRVNTITVRDNGGGGVSFAIG